MSIDKITSKILSQAEMESSATLEQGKAQSDAVLKEATEKAEMMLSESKAKGLDEKEKIISRRKSVADIDARKVVLAQKQAIIKECFEKSIEEIIGLDEASYIELLVAMGKASGLKKGLLIFNGNENKAIGQKVTDGLNKAVLDGQFVLSEETRNIKGGYMLKEGNTFINNTIESLVENEKEGLLGEVAKMLFPEGK